MRSLPGAFSAVKMLLFRACAVLYCADLHRVFLLAPPRKKARSNMGTAVWSSRGNEGMMGGASVEREDNSARRGSDDEREGHGGRQEVCSRDAPVSSPVAAATTPVAPSKGIILRSGRIRLPDKLIQVW